jgi:hypothetical protein
VLTLKTILFLSDADAPNFEVYVRPLRSSGQSDPDVPGSIPCVTGFSE